MVGLKALVFVLGGTLLIVFVLVVTLVVMESTANAKLGVPASNIITTMMMGVIALIVVNPIPLGTFSKIAQLARLPLFKDVAHLVFCIYLNFFDLMAKNSAIVCTLVMD